MHSSFLQPLAAALLLRDALAAPLLAPSPTPTSLTPRQDVGAAINAAADNDFAGAASIPEVLDLPTKGPAYALAGPSATGNPYGSLGLAGPNGDPAVINAGSPPSQPSLLPQQTAEPSIGLIFDFQDSDIAVPQPIRGKTGDSGGQKPSYPDTSYIDKVEPDTFAPPGTDSGDVPQGVWPIGLSHNTLGKNGSGWARQENKNNLPIATEMAGVDMRLEPHAYRELHWHSAGEWAFVISGSVRVATVNTNGQSFVDDLQEQDLWYFPPGVPHSLQALENGVEFLLVLDDGSFSEQATGLVTEMMLRTPREALAKNFHTSIPALADMPKDQLYIFPGTPAPANVSAQNVTGPNGVNNQPDTMYTYHLSQQPAMTIPGAGSLKMVDSTTFPAAADIAAALITIEPGAMRELHWHLDSDEWNFFLSGQARVSVYSPPSSARTFDYGPGDVGYIPATFSHYIENTGNESVVLLEMLKQPKFTGESSVADCERVSRTDT